jgi:hypothetical protein
VFTLHRRKRLVETLYAAKTKEGFLRSRSNSCSDAKGSLSEPIRQRFQKSLILWPVAFVRSFQQFVGRSFGNAFAVNTKSCSL